LAKSKTSRSASSRRHLLPAPAILALLYFRVAPWVLRGLRRQIATLIGAGSAGTLRDDHADDSASQIILSVITVGITSDSGNGGSNAKVLLAPLLLPACVSGGDRVITSASAKVRTTALLSRFARRRRREDFQGRSPTHGGGLTPRSRRCLRRRVIDRASCCLLTFMLSWFSDTGAYFAGGLARFLGKPKLYER
jgi:phosphatidate cytidylyltransferase